MIGMTLLPPLLLWYVFASSKHFFNFDTLGLANIFLLPQELRDHVPQGQVAQDQRGLAYDYGAR